MRQQQQQQQQWCSLGRRGIWGVLMALTLLQVLQGAMGVQPTVPQEEQRARACSQIQPVQHLNISQLEGQWLITELMTFSNSEPVEYEITNTSLCIRANASLQPPLGGGLVERLSLSSSARYPGNKPTQDVKNFLISTQNPGRWIVEAAQHVPSGTEVLVLSTSPSRYLVLVLCSDPSLGNPRGAPGPESVSVYVRAVPRRSGAGVKPLRVPKREMEALRGVVKNKLNLHVFNSVRLRTTCG